MVKIFDFPFKKKKGCNEIVKLESRYGFQSTIVVSSINKSSNYLSIEDPLYNFKDSYILNCLNSATKKGFSVALHPSIKTAPIIERYLEQKMLLENNLNQEVISIRHHYWNITREKTEDALLSMEKVGFKIDSSISFYKNINYRRSIAFPFYPFHTKLNRKLNIIEAPPSIMDNWIKRKDKFNKIQKELEITKSTNGCCVVDWHCNRFNNRLYKTQGDHYKAILETLCNEEDVWVTSLEGLYKWWDKRTTKLLEN